MTHRPFKTIHPFHRNLSDADLDTRIRIAFTSRPRIAWHNIGVAVRDASVTLRGVVPTVYDRQLVVAVTRHVAGVRLVDDELEVANESKAAPHREQDSVKSVADRNDRSSEKNAAEPRPHGFSHLPLVSESLEEIIERTASATLVQK